jgi:cystathionine beta-lyase
MNNVTVHHVDTTQPDIVIQFVSPKTRLVLLETPTNPLIKIADLKGIVDRLRQFPFGNEILVVVDNTMMSPYLQRPLLLGVDIVYHSGTKYLSGHHDLMAGVIGTRHESIAKVPALPSFFMYYV